MRRVAELIDRRDAFEPVAAVDQEPRVAGEGRGIAGDRDHAPAPCSPRAAAPAPARPAAADRTRRRQSRAIPAASADGGTGRALRPSPASGPRSRSRPSAGRRPRRHRCRRQRSARCSRAAARTGRRRRTDRRCAWRARMLGDQRCQRLFAGAGRLQERAGRQRHLRGADGDDRRRAHQHQFAVPRQPRQAMLFGKARQRRDHRGRQRTGAAHVDIEAVTASR